jgi:hypothetical protein
MLRLNFVTYKFCDVWKMLRINFVIIIIESINFVTDPEKPCLNGITGSTARFTRLYTKQSMDSRGRSRNWTDYVRMGPNLHQHTYILRVILSTNYWFILYWKIDRKCPVYAYTLVFASVPNSKINSWETWFIFNLRKNKQNSYMDNILYLLSFFFSNESLFETWCTATCRQRINAMVLTPNDLFSWNKRDIRLTQHWT